MSVEESMERLRAAGRNDSCPCGSGKKYKKCHLREDEEAQSAQLAKINEEAAKAAEAEAAEHEHDCEDPDCKEEHGKKQIAKPKTALAGGRANAPAPKGKASGGSSSQRTIPRKAS